MLVEERKGRKMLIKEKKRKEREKEEKKEKEGWS